MGSVAVVLSGPTANRAGSGGGRDKPVKTWRGGGSGDGRSRGRMVVVARTGGVVDDTIAPLSLACGEELRCTLLRF
jgi:hypothetical protein